ncbi:MAG: hypothetical protein KC877_04450 [Candidatus Kaiserbacteria bacterium]|nr:hypothetical protein [Candidatus Kaiserbacteria bacterium]MCB9816569.1 hypothetical protein [Candidatus Nomurabacteria bacterium]
MYIWSESEKRLVLVTPVDVYQATLMAWGLGMMFWTSYRAAALINQHS